MNDKEFLQEILRFIDWDGSGTVNGGDIIRTCVACLIIYSTPYGITVADNIINNTVPAGLTIFQATCDILSFLSAIFFMLVTICIFIIGLVEISKKKVYKYR